MVVTESVFSVDGDLAPLAELHAVARRTARCCWSTTRTRLGVLGPAGAGGVAAAGLAGEPDVVVTATLSKALGGAGGVVAGPAEFVRHLVDTGRTFIFDTAPPPAVAAGVRAALGLARAADDLRAELRDAGARLAVTRLRRGRADRVRRRTAAVLSVPAPGAGGGGRLGRRLPGPGRRGRLLPAAVHPGQPFPAAADRSTRRCPRRTSTPALRT